MPKSFGGTISMQDATTQMANYMVPKREPQSPSNDFLYT